MKKICNKCGNKIKELNFTKEQKYYLLGVLKQDLKLFAIKKIVDDFGMNKKDAKVVIAHLNNENGTCIKCDYKKLKGENVECPKCGAFNYNLEESEYNKELSSHPEWSLHFCSQLEWSLDFENLGDDTVKGFWCDGIKDFPTHNIEKNKEVITKAWIGKDGQGIYKMKIKFGKQSIENYKNGLSVIDCIPKIECHNWVKIYPKSMLGF